MLTIEDIRIYPVKGLRGFSVTEAMVEPWGLGHDRRWMVVDPSGRFITQRQVPRMAVIGIGLLPNGLALSAEGCGTCEEPVPGPGADRLDVTVWDDTVTAKTGTCAAADWLTRALGVACRLVHMADPASDRPVDPEFSSPGDVVSFADGFPLLVTTKASLADLNARLPAPVAMDRFRPNIVVGGATPWAEDGWSRLRVGDVTFDGTKECARCAVTTIDQDTGVRAQDNEPLRTLGQFRRKAKGRIIFGQNLVPRSAGRIRTGDIVTVSAA